MISVAIITYNEEDRIRATLESVKDLVDEIIIIDSGSTDRTEEIALSYNAKFIFRDWTGFSDQKNYSLEMCNGDWILSLDADEVLSPELVDEIKDLIKNDHNYSYKINRKTVYLGKIMNYMWQPDLQLRLVRKDHQPEWDSKIVHESMNVNGEVRTLKNHLIHYSYRDLNDHFKKMIKYSKLGAIELENNGTEMSFLKIFLNPSLKFIKQYFIKGAYKDGMHGLLGAFSSVVYTFMKYAYLFEIKNMRNNED